MESMVLHGARVHVGRCAFNKTILDLYNKHYVMVQYMNINNEKTVIQTPVSYPLISKEC